MFATIFAVIIAVLLFVKGDASDLEFMNPTVKFFVSTLPLIFYFYLNGSAFSVLQKSEQNLTPRIFQVIQSDWRFKWILHGFLVLPFVSILLSLNLGISPFILSTIWLVLLGISFDFLCLFYGRLTQYLNPFAYINNVVSYAKSALRDNSSEELKNSMDALFEVAVKSVDKGSMALGLEAINGLQKIVAAFFDHSHFRMANSDKAEEILQEVSYVQIYFLQRLEGIYARALNQGLEPILSGIILLVGKSVLYGAKCDSTLALPPLHFLGKFAKAAQDKGVEEVAIKAAITLQEVGNTFLTNPELFSMPLREIFSALINQLEILTKAAFKRDKNINLNLLITPFQSIRETLQNEKIAVHPDAPAIMADLDRVMGEFEALGMILATMPNIPGYNK